MWVITVFNNIQDIRMFEYTNKEEATKAMAAYKSAILSYTK